jgi:hypothetical protein
MLALGGEMLDICRNAYANALQYFQSIIPSCRAALSTLPGMGFLISTD